MEIPEEYTVTHRDEPFLLYDSGIDSPARILIFSTETAAASEQLVTAVLMICWAVSSVSIALRLIAFFNCRVSLRHGSAAWLCVLTIPTISSPLTLILALQLLRRLGVFDQVHYCQLFLYV
jgi:hypothetical protein